MYAAGVLPYTVYKSKIYILLGKEGRGLSDFGGYTDDVSEKSSTCAAREFSEETLGLFSSDESIRGRKQGVKHTTTIMDSILSEYINICNNSNNSDNNNATDSHHKKLIKLIKSRNNGYNMYIAPVPRFLLSNEFKYAYTDNENQEYHHRILSTEKTDIWWVDIQQMIQVIETFGCKEIDIRGVSKRLYINFVKTIRDPQCLEFLKYLNSHHDSAEQLVELEKQINEICKLF
ncbi:hypothetical protein CYY_004354 [Polysphondylium violaceum]|uniref:Nudix hydrolase domain-containing protein n=1 Tax=Polysphondylium violaceum TaxID=133409 RepID=A0A8J4PUQ9_9MYCE|nr:hypothetical protein CYY_004354 [Polysphondylium violaceum]